MGTNNIVLVHGLWMTPLSWEYWAHHYTERGYRVFAPSWPGMEHDIRTLRRDPDASIITRSWSSSSKARPS
jgi:pimeloyl-ACP methyl ester carboxylesterase